MNNLLWMLSETNAGEELKDTANNLFQQEIWPILRVVLWVLAAVLAVVFVVKAITTAMAVMKAADEPQVRQEKLSGFKYLAIGLGIAIVVLVLAATLVPIIADFGEVGNLPESTSFLF